MACDGKLHRIRYPLPTPFSSVMLTLNDKANPSEQQTFRNCGKVLYNYCGLSKNTYSQFEKVAKWLKSRD
jgi:hypothetical protein